MIRTGFIYKPADVELVGASKILIDEAHFGNAREPLAQAFKPAGASDATAFARDRQPLQVQGLRAPTTAPARATPTPTASVRPRR